MKARLGVILRRIGLVWLIWAVAGTVAGQQLPHRDDPGLTRAEACYWTDSLLPYVACGAEVSHGSEREVFYNVPWCMVMLPAILIQTFVATVAGSGPVMGSAEWGFLAVAALGTALLYAPLAPLVWAGVARLRRRRAAAPEG